ncbi:hypothetical protein [Streptomyces sp. CBMA123]|uniref:hypothetical protein n=1 Tax=Streptomyces sp. CBMA123 TaxID=1896313 RepID=UPI001661980C|nr:hypothetical protein [Streptomyces sp. CBMA123]MBD0696092.1 hypothetical protein [Streptomyces sp. CBMA123]
MFRATAAVRRPHPAGPAALPRLVRAAGYAPAGRGTPYQPGDAREEFYAELGAPYRASFDRAQFAAAGRRTSVELAYGALDALGPLDAEDAPEMAVIAYAAPDFEHTELVASCVRRRLPGDPLAFALSDQGRLAPFSALRVAVEYARRCGWSRLLLLAVDQGTQPFPLPTDSPAGLRGDAAVALLLRWDGGDRPLGGQALGRPGPGLFAHWPADAALVAGAGLAEGPELPPHQGTLARGAAGRPATGSWSALLDAVRGTDDAPGTDDTPDTDAGPGTDDATRSNATTGSNAGPGTGAGNRPVVVADYDRDRDALAYCTLDTGEWRHR